MTRMTGPDCAVVCNLKNIHTYIHTYIYTPRYAGFLAFFAGGCADVANGHLGTVNLLREAIS